MRGRYSIGTYIIFGLLAIGLLFSLTTIFIPILVLGAIFLLYKFPPSTWRKVTMYRKDDGKRHRKARYRVIHGTKRDDDPPRYH
ncbi:hypothetical protein ACFFK0_27180 [Paenibacillus chartarius]|uniref:Uncharacterized protein n=1 Tax=Paenibacillus chartarius TaxID=747481 RepID=A0ABV6DTU5_9BACL